MILGYIFMKKTYSYLQVFSVVVVTFGVVVATLSRPATPSARVTTKTTQNDTDVYQYATGILMLAASCVLTSTLGILQEQTFAKHGKDTWREGIFYTVRKSLLFSLFFKTDLFAPVASPVSPDIRPPLWRRPERPSRTFDQHRQSRTTLSHPLRAPPLRRLPDPHRHCPFILCPSTQRHKPVDLRLWC